MNIRKTIYTIAVASIASVFSSCSDFLDVSKELSKDLNKEEVFSNYTYLKQWYGKLYSTVPRYSETGLDIVNNSGEFPNIWAIYSGELICAHPNVLQHGQNTFTTQVGYHRWASCYKEIRQAMIYLENAPATMGDPSDRDGYRSEEDMRRMKADVIYLMAYNYFLLFEMYGPVPIVQTIADPESADLDLPRASVKETVEYIDGLLEQIIEGEYSDVLPDNYKQGNSYNYTEMLRPTKAAALALRARLWVYAASPLFNGGYPEALLVTDKSGKQLFEPEDRSRWQTAKTHLEALLNFADSHGMGLYKYLNPDGTEDPHMSVYYLFQELNDEILWANPTNDYSAIGSRMEPRTAPWSLGYASTIGGNVGPYQELVDMFFTKDGLTIEDGLNNGSYKETGFSDIQNPCTNIEIDTKVTKKHVDKHIFNMYANREPRFYSNITYEGKSWHIQPSSYPDWGAYFSVASKSSYKGDDTNARTGYLLYKFNNRDIMKNNGNKTSWGRPWIYFRLADFYLYYAEVLNEIDPSNSNIIKYLDMVRERAGIPGYREMNDNGTKTGIIGNQNAQREAIYQERIVEMFAEGNYYFDMHRWMRAGWSKDENTGRWIKDNEDKAIIRTGMNINEITVTAFKESANKQAKTFREADGPGTYYNRIVIDRFPWKKAMLLYPVPYNEMQKSKLMVQNPLWN